MSKKAQVQNEAAIESAVTTTESTDQVKTITGDASTNVSQKIRSLAALGMKMGPIVKALTESGYVTKNGTPIRFQHVRNVLTTQPKKA